MYVNFRFSKVTCILGFKRFLKRVEMQVYQTFSKLKYKLRNYIYHINFNFGHKLKLNSSNLIKKKKRKFYSLP